MPSVKISWISSQFMLANGLLVCHQPVEILNPITLI